MVKHCKNFEINISPWQTLFAFAADDPFDDFFGGRSRQRGAHRSRMGGSLFGFGGFPAFGPGYSGFDSGLHILYIFVITSYCIEIMALKRITLSVN